jgi:hypothetical protein
MSSFSTPFKFTSATAMATAVAPTTAKKTAFSTIPEERRSESKGVDDDGGTEVEGSASVTTGTAGAGAGAEASAAGLGSVFFSRLKKTFASTAKKPPKAAGVHFSDDSAPAPAPVSSLFGRWLSPEGKSGRALEEPEDSPAGLDRLASAADAASDAQSVTAG